jgi:hypothetical protein
VLCLSSNQNIQSFFNIFRRRSFKLLRNGSVICFFILKILNITQKFIILNKNREFEKIAFDILQKSYLTDPMKAELTLIRKISEFDCTTIQAAVASTNLDIIAHNCFQSVLVRIWYHKIIPDISSYKVFHLIINRNCPKSYIIMNIFNFKDYFFDCYSFFITFFA